MTLNLRATRDTFTHPLRGALLLGTLMIIAPAAYADCEARVASAKEQEFFARLQASLAAAMPAAPEAMELLAAPSTHVTLPCQGTPQGDTHGWAEATYRYQMPRAQADGVAREQRDLQAQLDAAKALPPEAKREYDALEARRQETFRDARRADKAGDKALASQKYREAMALEAQREDVRKRHEAAAKPQIEGLESRLRALPVARAELTVRLEANGWGPTPHVTESELRLGRLPPPKGKGFKVHGLQVIVAGPAPNKAQREAMLAALDRARLQALMDQPLPATPPAPAWRVGVPSGTSAAGETSSGASESGAAFSTQSASSGESAAEAPRTAPAMPETDAAKATADKAMDAVNRLRGLFGR